MCRQFVLSRNSFTKTCTAYGCVAGYEAHPNAKFTSWRILSLVTGLVSVVFGICMFIFLADSVVTARWLSEDDRVLAIERLRSNHQGVGSTEHKHYQLREAWLDYRTWLYVVFVLASQIPSAGLVLLNSILVQSLGFDTKTTLLLAMPGGLVNICANAGFGWLADKTRMRLLACILATLVSNATYSPFYGGEYNHLLIQVLTILCVGIGVYLWRWTFRRARQCRASAQAFRPAGRVLFNVRNICYSVVHHHLAYEFEHPGAYEEDLKQCHCFHGPWACIFCWSTVLYRCPILSQGQGHDVGIMDILYTNPRVDMGFELA